MANDNFDRLIEDHVITVLDDNTSYQNTKFYGLANAQAMIEWIRGRLTSGKGSVFVRVSAVNPEPIDTIGKLYNVDYNVQIIVAYPAMRIHQLDGTRETEEMKESVRGLMLNNPITIESVPRRFIWSNEDSVVFEKEVDAQLIEFRIENLVVEFS